MKYKCENCDTERAKDFPVSDETGEKYCPNCNWTFDKLTYCECGLNPNDSQSQEQQQWESDYIKENGVCSACDNEKCFHCGKVLGEGDNECEHCINESDLTNK